MATKVFCLVGISGKEKDCNFYAMNSWENTYHQTHLTYGVHKNATSAGLRSNDQLVQTVAPEVGTSEFHRFDLEIKMKQKIN